MPASPKPLRLATINGKRVRAGKRTRTLTRIPEARTMADWLDQLADYCEAEGTRIRAMDHEGEMADVVERLYAISDRATEVSQAFERGEFCVERKK